MKDILIITNYYPPEIGAASNRIKHLAEILAERGYNTSVLTPLPNYPTGTIFKGYKGKLLHSSKLNKVKVIRLWIYASNSKNRFLRLLSMLSYSISLSLFFLFKKIPNKVIIQSPPLIVAFCCLLLLKSKKRKLILNVSDLWPSAGLELGALKPGLFSDMLAKVERFNYKAADIVLGQSDEILNHISRIAPNKKSILYRNYPVLEGGNFQKSDKVDSANIQLFYAGLLGVAQGVLNLCKKLDYTNLEFHIYGEGAEKAELLNYIQENKDLPLFYHGNLERNELHKQIVKHDLGLIPLVRRIYGSVPSKIFEYAKLGIPIIYFGGGEGEKIVLEHGLGLVVKAGDFEELNHSLSEIKPITYSISTRTAIKETAKREFVLKNQIDQLIKQF